MGLTSRALDYSIRSLIKPYLKKVVLDEAGLAQLRQLAQFGLGKLKSPQASIRQHILDGIEFEEILPLGGEVRGEMLYCPGGGYICCSPETHRNLTVRLANMCHLRVWSLNYSKVPEVGLTRVRAQALRIYEFLLEEVTRGQGPIFFGGDSAGGHLAISTLLDGIAKGLPSPSGLVCLSPWTDLSCPVEGRLHQDWDPLIPLTKLQVVAAMCLQGESPYNPYYSPVYADLSLLPPTLVQAVTTEVLYHDSTRFVARAQEAGAIAHLSSWTDVPHCFQLLAPYLSQAVSALDEIEYFISSQLEQKAIPVAQPLRA